MKTCSCGPDSGERVLKRGGPALPWCVERGNVDDVNDRPSGQGSGHVLGPGLGQLLGHGPGQLLGHDPGQVLGPSLGPSLGPTSGRLPGPGTASGRLPGPAQRVVEESWIYVDEGRQERELSRQRGSGRLLTGRR